MAAPVDTAELATWLRSMLAEVLGVEVSQVDPDRPFTELGLASRDAMVLVGELSERLDRVIEPTVVYRTPTVSGLAALLAEQAGEQGGEEDGGTVAPSELLPGDDMTEVGAREVGPDGRAPGDVEDEAIAVVGLGCRLPGGVHEPDAFWRQLLAGREAIGEVPPGRWEAFATAGPAADAAIAATPRRGGFLADIAGFDAEHFGITPREAEVMDPQQRMLLEVAWEALAHAGIAPADLAGSRTGVWIGLSGTEYGLLTTADASRVDAWTPTGAAASIAANRLSYLLDLRGPSLTVDTACSSSLVAVHLAVRAIRAGDADLALVGGANLLLAPTVTTSFHRAGALAPDGRCKPFSARADGIVRSEAVAVVVLKRLARAVADGDRVLAVIRAAEVNSDGRSNGLMAPNPAAQEALLRRAYDAAGVDPATLDYVEAHGTGTLLGDPVEASALGAVLGRGRDRGRPLLIGSVKGNLGHAEAAAGVVGLVKTVLALQHGLLPPSLHAAARNPHLRFADWGLDVITRPRPWPRYSGRARAGVSAFGFGGTNAHVVLEEYLPETASAPRRRGPDDVVTAVLAAADDERLADRAGALADRLETARGIDLGDVAHTLARRAAGGARRAVVAGRGRDGLVAGLRALAEGRQVPGVIHELPAVPTVLGMAGSPPRPGAVWVFSGYGSAWPGMGARLLADCPAFAAAVDAVDTLLREQGHPFEVRRALRAGATGGPDGLGGSGGSGGSPSVSVADTQVALFTVQVALAASWRAAGHVPSAVIGHSLGEVAAAVVAGALSLADGVRVVTVRSDLLNRVNRAGGGAMAVVDLSEAEFDDLAGRFGTVTVAVHASPRQLTVAGDRAGVEALVAHVERLGRGAWVLPVAGAGHSAAVDPVLDELTARLDGLCPRPPEVRVYSTVLDDSRAVPAWDAAYWRAGLRRPVRFAQAVTAAAADGFGIFVEVSPHPVAAAAISATLSVLGAPGVVVPTLRRGTDDTVTFRAQLAALASTPGYVAEGVPDDPEGLGIPVGRVVDLPGPVWRHRPYWVEVAEPARSAAGSGPPSRRGHPLLGIHVELPGDAEHAFTADVGLLALSWLGDHRVHGVAVLPAAAFAEIALAAAGVALGTRGRPVPATALVLTDLELHRLLVLEDVTEVTTTTRRTGPGSVRVDVHARSGARPTGPLTRIATATATVAGAGDRIRVTEGAAADVMPDLVGVAVDVHEVFAAVGHRYGPAFRGAGEAVLRPDGTTVARVDLPPAADADPHLAVHPALLDACLQVLAPSAAAARPATADLFLPFAVGRLRVTGDPQRGGRCEASVTVDDAGLLGRVRLVADDGTELLVAEDVLLRPLRRDAVEVPLAEKAFELVWQDEPVTDAGGGSPVPARWLVVDAVSASRSAAVDVAALAAALAPDPVVRHAGPSGLAAALPGPGGGAGPGGVGVVLVLGGVLGGSTDPADGRAADDVLAVARVARELVDASAGDPLATPPRLWIVTGAAPGLRGLVRVLALEHPRLQATLVELGPLPGVGGDARESHQDVAALVARELRSGSADDEVAWWDGRRRVRRVARARVVPLADRPELRPGAYVISGGLGGLGLLVAEHLVEHLAGQSVEPGPIRLVLAGRTADPDVPPAPVAALAARGVDVRVVRADVSRPADVDRILAVATADGVPLRGVVHAAGVLADGLVTELTADALARVWAPKVLGGWALHHATAGCDLDLWCAFSSAAGLLGSPGQAAYAAANAWLDALVEARRAAGLPATSIAWGAWSGVGGADPARNPLLDPITPAEGLGALDAVLAAGRTLTGVVRLDVERMAALLPDALGRPFFAAVTAAPGSSDGSGTGPDDGWAGVEALRAADPATARRHLVERLVERVATIMGHRPGELDTTRPLTDLGVDSLMAVRAKNAVEADTGVSLPVRLLLQGASLAALADLIADALELPVPGSTTAGPPSPPPRQPPKDGPRDAPRVGPRDAAERWLVSVWAPALGVDTGALSVTAPLDPLLPAAAAGARATVSAELLARFGCDLDPDVVLALPTVEQQADLVRGLLEGGRGSVVRVLRAPQAVTAGGDGVPLFLFHPAGGPTSVYQPLLSLLPADRPVYGLERIESARTVEEKAERYLAELRRLQPAGPYRLGGWSLGGCLAYEVAGRLRAAGDEVDALFMIDSVLPERTPGVTEREVLRERFVRFAAHVHDTYGVRLDLDPDEVVTLDEDGQVDAIMAAVEQALPGVGPALLEHQRTSYVDARVAERYRPRPYAGRVVLYRATEVGLTATLDPRYARVDDALGWDLLVGDLDVVKVPGDHTSIIDRPGVDVIAEHLAAVLAARAGDGATVP